MRFLTKCGLLLTLSFIISLTACYQDEIIDNTVVVEDEPQIVIEETGVAGRARDINNNVLTNYELVVNNTVFNCDNGFYYHSLINAHKRGQFIFLQKDNAVIGLTNAYLIENDINFVELIAFPEKEKSSFTNQLTLSPSLELQTSDAVFIHANETVAEESILVNHFTTSDQRILNNAGTSARGLANQIVAIHSKTLFFFDFEKEDGEKIQFSADSGFTLSTVLADNEALFYLNVEKDEWMAVREGEPLKSGYYLLAEFTDGVYMEGEIVKENTPVSFMSYDWEWNNYNYSGLSSSLGRWGTVVSQVADFELELQSPCGDALQSENLQSELTPKEDVSILIHEDVDQLAKIETKIFDCEGNIQTISGFTLEDDTNGMDQDFIYLFNDAEVDTWVPVCSADFKVGGYNILENTNGPLINWSLNQDDEIEYLSNCENFENGYSYIKIKNDMRLYEPFTVEKVEGTLTKVNEKSGKISIIFDGGTAGLYDETDVGIKIDDPEFVQSHGYFVECNQSGCGINDFNVTHFEESEDGWLRVSFSGTIWMLKTGSPNVAGNFDVEGVILCRL